MQWFLWARLKSTVIIRVHDILRMTDPRRVWRSVMNTQIERIFILCVSIDIVKGIIRNHIRHIAGHNLCHSITYHVLIIVCTRPARMRKPVRKSTLRKRRLAQMPFARQATCPPIVSQDVCVTNLTIEKTRSCSSKIDRTRKKIVNAVLRRNPPGQKRSSAGRTHRNRHEEILKPHACCRHAVEAWRSNFGIAITTRRPDSHVIGKNEDDIGLL